MRHQASARAAVSLLLLVAVATTAAAQETGPYSAARPFGTLRRQAEVQQAWLKERLEVNLPAVMRAHGVDMWVVTMREYNEDPVFRGLVSATTFAARRRSIYIFFDRGPAKGVERLALGGTSQGGLYEVYRGEQSTSTTQKAELWGMEQWRLFARLVTQRNPKAIAVNISADHNFADGLTAGEWEQMKEALGPDLERRVVRNPRLAIDYLALRVPGMAPTYRRLQAIVHEVIGAAFSNLVITPGVTTTEDVVWWMRQRVNDMGLGTWFQPSVDVQRMGATEKDLGDNPVIQRGDVLHCDFGITAMGLNTDTQHMAYVLRDGETDAPAGLGTALARANRLQDILLEKTTPGKSGNQVLREVLGQMSAEGLEGTMYSHPIGDHGHGAGPLIGLWDYQEGVPGRGDVPVLPNMWFSTELQVTTAVPEWNGQKVRMALEEEAEVRPDGVMQWSLRRQTELHLVR
ncbi:MAG: aminopeptidase P family protein [Acidobacteria bacterium]|nr:aminopeptidase P family protein [Acidobacteriota bacterium]